MRDIKLRCYAKMSEGSWYAFCVDLNLVDQRDTLKEVKKAMEENIDCYLGDTQDIKRIFRRPPFSYMLEYYWVGFLEFFAIGLSRHFSIIRRTK